MRRRLSLLGLFLLFGFLPLSVFAANCGDTLPSDPGELGRYIDSCTQKITQSKQQQQTLTAALTVINSQIRLTQAQISQTINQINSLEKDIANLASVVSDLDKSLVELSRVFVAHVRESYLRRSPDPLTLFLGSDDFGKFFTTLRYLNIVKARDQLILSEITSAKANYDIQKTNKIEKQKQVEELKTKLLSQQSDLKAQQLSKQRLLVETQNDEKKFQSLLSQARAELEAINAIIAGKGEEKEVGDVNKGDLIARVIGGPSCNSGGSHLHFMVADQSSIQNPFNYLKSVEHENCSGSSCGSADGDPFNPSGSWDWPLNPAIRFNQGYGVTWAVKNTWVGSVYNSHNGIDINSGSDEVHAVASGRLFRGTYSGTDGCALKYVRVNHKDGSLMSFYLHVNYTL